MRRWLVLGFKKGFCEVMNGSCILHEVQAGVYEQSFEHLHRAGEVSGVWETVEPYGGSEAEDACGPGEAKTWLMVFLLDCSSTF